ncbi:DUF421 domain-containing protein [Sphingobacterium faecale]|uniref:DUF421 domain-containing protein n=1 Tax=Sphingobacterium faecale TaxID=2803775 RepID=A0ABS1R4I5_9SPHI|nr:YetF domain-containing protein [Sphingobacterium faecale]MBL1409624.1 DUF421 domain-containing protein [Sphingobacterium faecale]
MEAYINVIVRCIVVYIFMLTAIRVFGKKELSQLNTVDVILILLISNAVQNAMVGEDTSLQGGLVAASVLFLVNFIIKRTVLKNKFLQKLVQQKPQILVHKGKPDFVMLSKIGISADELYEAMREHGIEHIKDVKLAMFEEDGNISIISGESVLKHSVYKRKHNHKNLQGAN